MSARIAFIPGEEVVSSIDNVTLTNKRIRYDSAMGGSSKFVSITLDSIASCGLTTKSSLLLIMLGVLAILVAFAQKGRVQVLLFFVAAILGIVYLITRRATMCIASKGGQSISIPIRGMKRSSVIEFLEAVEQEKLRE